MKEREKNSSLKIWQKGVKTDKIGRLKDLYDVKIGEEAADEANKLYLSINVYVFIFFMKISETSWKLLKWQ